jgi:hypothetical protein
VSQALQQALAILSADRFKTVGQFWQAVAMPPDRQGAYAGSSNNAQVLPSKSIPMDSDKQISQKVPAIPVSKTGRALRLCAILLLMLAIGTGYFAYERSVTLLLLCSLGIFLLALAGLLIGGMMRSLNPRQRDTSGL